MVKNITLSADENLIEAVRRIASTRNTTLNAEFRVWLANYVNREAKTNQAMRTVDELSGKLRVGQKLTREKMNER